MPHKGQCLCGQTTIELATTHNEQVRAYFFGFSLHLSLLAQAVCHCTDCKQTSGSAFSTNALTPRISMSWSKVQPRNSTSRQLLVTQVRRARPISFPAQHPSVTRVFCGNCGSAITHLSPAFGDAQAIQTGNFKDFASIPIKTEREFYLHTALHSDQQILWTNICWLFHVVFVKDRWTGIAKIEGAAQVQAMSWMEMSMKDSNEVRWSL